MQGHQDSSPSGGMLRLAESAGRTASTGDIAIRAARVEIVAGVEGEYIVQCCPWLVDAFLELGRSADGGDSTPMHDGDTLAETVGLFHVVCCQENRHTDLIA